MSNRNWADLPYEVLFNVLKHLEGIPTTDSSLTLNSLLYLRTQRNYINCQLVCKNWKIVATPFLHRNIHVNSKVVVTLLEWLKKSPKHGTWVRYIKFQKEFLFNNNDPANVCRQFLRLCPRLEYLDCEENLRTIVWSSMSTFRDGYFAQLKDFIHCWSWKKTSRPHKMVDISLYTRVAYQCRSTLKSLYLLLGSEGTQVLSNMAIEEMGVVGHFSILVHQLDQFVSLEKLNISFSSPCSVETLKSILSKIPKSVQQLKMDELNLRDDQQHQRAILDILPHDNSVKTIIINELVVSSAAVDVLSLVVFPNLQHLTVDTISKEDRQNDISWSTLVKLFNMPLSSCKIQVKNNSISTEVLQHCVDYASSVNGKQKVLKLSHCYSDGIDNPEKKGLQLTSTQEQIILQMVINIEHIHTYNVNKAMAILKQFEPQFVHAIMCLDTANYNICDSGSCGMYIDGASRNIKVNYYNWFIFEQLIKLCCYHDHPTTLILEDFILFVEPPITFCTLNKPKNIDKMVLKTSMLHSITFPFISSVIPVINNLTIENPLFLNNTACQLSIRLPETKIMRTLEVNCTAYDYEYLSFSSCCQIDFMKYFSPSKQAVQADVLYQDNKAYHSHLNLLYSLHDEDDDIYSTSSSDSDTVDPIERTGDSSDDNSEDSIDNSPDDTTMNDVVTDERPVAISNMNAGQQQRQPSEEGGISSQLAQAVDAALTLSSRQSSVAPLANIPSPPSIVIPPKPPKPPKMKHYCFYIECELVNQVHLT
ncbi:hypothetical protein BDF20DRAFT_686472 [Mycotypha africana]|uniref:uncharacterized protein n=1 Tax=Mycotypha africana TaxID=64632 RepID=UPI00230183B2|nr:uncharacterized protein BDF20DRAFT_686472 [Mycotypha africana]KAI8971572.1 hypothetical protein BDF20DRAFT_686472 [Mycotypha africana]